MNAPTIRCILFDLGDTLWYREDKDVWERLETAVDQRAVALLYQHFPPDALPFMDAQTLGKRLRKAFEERIRDAIRQTPTIEPVGAQIALRALATLGIACEDLTLGAQLFEALRVRIPESRPLFDDVLTTLDALRSRGFRLGIVTNRIWGGQPFYEDLRTIGLLNYFDANHIAISGDLGIRKPNPAIFQYALRALDVAPGETAMVGDSLSADIVGAQALNIFAIWKPKPWLHAWVEAQREPDMTMIDRQAAQDGEREAYPGADTADTQYNDAEDKPLAGMYVTDDDYVLARAATSRDYLEQFRRGEIRPDMIITRISALVDVFAKVGSR